MLLILNRISLFLNKKSSGHFFATHDRRVHVNNIIIN